MLTKEEISEQEADFDGLKRIAVAYFGSRVHEFMSLPVDEHVRLARLAGVSEEQMPGVYKALMTFARALEDCPRMQ